MKEKGVKWLKNAQNQSIYLFIFVSPIWIANLNKIKRSIIMKHQNVMEISTISHIVVSFECGYNQRETISYWWFVSLWLISLHIVVFSLCIAYTTFRWFVVYIASFHCCQVFLCCLILRLAPFFLFFFFYAFV